jgi:hypothetical protein
MVENSPATAPSGMLRVPLGQLYACECRWPVGESARAIGRHLFCGKLARPGEVYCPAHMLLSRGER